MLKKTTLASTSSPKVYPTEATDLVWGIHPVLELLQTQPRLVRKLSIVSARAHDKVQEIILLAKEQHIRIDFVPELKFDRKPAPNHQGVLAHTAALATLSLEELLAKQEESELPPFLVALDSIQDPHNLGAIIRTAAAAGATGLIVTKDRAAPLTSTVAKISAGAIAHLAICQVTNLATTLRQLKAKGIWIFGAAGESGQSLHQADLRGPLCLVIGGEENGIRPLVRSHCDFLLAIPMAGKLNSLNASVAAGVILFEAVRQRQK